MADHERRALAQQVPEACHQVCFTERVEGASRLVEQEKGSVAEVGASQCQPLPLPTAEVVTAFERAAEGRIESSGQGPDRGFDASSGCRRRDRSVVVGTLHVTEGYVVSRAGGEADRRLEHDAHESPQVREPVRPDVAAVDQDASFLWLVQPT